MRTERLPPVAMRYPKAGIDILAKEGMSELSLRKVAHKAGVSHAAPYAHFSDKIHTLSQFVRVKFPADLLPVSEKPRR